MRSLIGAGNCGLSRKADVLFRNLAGAEILEVIHGNFRLIYEIKAKKIEVLTIWHTNQPGKRHLSSNLF